jgi:hypothetical protein
MGFYLETGSNYANGVADRYSRLTTEEKAVLAIPTLSLMLTPRIVALDLAGMGFYAHAARQGDADGLAIVTGGNATWRTGAAGINGNAAFSFDNLSYLDMPKYGLPNSFSIFAAIRHTTTSVIKPIYSCPTATVGNAVQLYINASNQLACRMGSLGSQVKTYTGLTLVDGQDYIVGISHNRTETTTNLRLYIGNPITATPVLTDNWTNIKQNFPSSHFFGSVGSADWRWDGLAGPVVVLNEAVHSTPSNPRLVTLMAYLNDYLTGTAGKYV